MKNKSYVIKTRNSQYILIDINKPCVKRFHSKHYPDGIEISNVSMSVGNPFMARFTNNEENIRNGVAGKVLQTSAVIDICENKDEPLKQQNASKQYIVTTQNGTVYSFEQDSNSKDSNDVKISCKQNNYHSLPATLINKLREGRPFMFTVKNSAMGEKLGLIGKTVSTSPVTEIRTIEPPPDNVKQRETIDIGYDNVSAQSTIDFAALSSRLLR